MKGNTASVHAWIFALDQVVVCMVTTRPPKTIVEPTALGTVANTDSKLLIYRLFQKGRVLAQDGVGRQPCGVKYPRFRADSKGVYAADLWSISKGPSFGTGRDPVAAEGE